MEAPKDLPTLSDSPVAGEDPAKVFLRDQVKAAQMAREVEGENVPHRVDACHLAMRYFETFTAGETPSLARVIETARVFERFLLER